LWSFWYDGLPKGTVKWGVRVADLGTEPSRPVVMGSHYDLVVIADGGWSELRTRYFSSARPEYAGYVAWRFRVSAAHVQGFQAFGEYANEHYRAIFLPVTQNDGADFVMGGTVMSVPAEDLPADAPADSPVNRQASSDGSAAASIRPASSMSVSLSNFMSFFRAKFGHHARGELLKVMEAAAAQGKITPLPQHEFAAECVVKGRLLLVGDAAHMASPRTAAGAHTAVLDATELFHVFSTVSNALPQSSSFSPGDIDHALRLYAPLGARRAAELLARSHQVSSEVVPAGWRRKQSQGDL
jgi:2-polyprenyl-6-methoxyphenol hydroxylase-like FAD-dependent oxidoreductase